MPTQPLGVKSFWQPQMPFSLEGWIEVARSPDTAEPHAWFGAVDLSAIVDVAYQDAERLFGLSKACVSGQKAVNSLAAGRGVPANPSAQVRRALDDIAAHEAKFGSGDMGGYTYALWAEIRDYALSVPPAAGGTEDSGRSIEQWPKSDVELGHGAGVWLLWGALACLGITAAAALGALVVLYRLAGSWGCA